MTQAAPPRPARLRLIVQGRVQGVGFRPTVYRHAKSLGLTGWVSNSAAGVRIEAEGPPDALRRFVGLVKGSPPPKAVVASALEEWLEPSGLVGFEIRESVHDRTASTLFPPDLALCDACRRELGDPADRRHQYPFTNCTDCGPRFTIVLGLPYDRPATTMAGFRMCPECQAEYDDPETRRFHAQPNACPACGPHVEWVDRRTDLGPRQEALPDAESIALAAAALAAGQIVAIQSLGGFHLACDATSEEAAAELRRRKERPEKPLAVMVRDLEAARSIAVVGPPEAEALASAAAPIVMLDRRDEGRLAPSLAPGLATVGVMLAYTPLHEVLLARLAALRPGAPPVLVMTSGNRQDEPICRTRAESQAKLGDLADAFLFHDRPIHNRCDDSVVFVAAGRSRPIRRARGFVPDPIELELGGPPVLACGADLKGAFCLTRERQAFLSQHLGELDEVENLDFFREALDRLTAFLEVQPGVVAHDSHPDYLSTRLALERGLPAIAVQHHHAHLAGVLAEGRRSGPWLGVALDGTGLGTDGTLWGCELLLVDGERFERLGHLRTAALPGGDAAARQGWRMALSWMGQLLGPEEALSRCRRLWPDLPETALGTVSRMCARGFQSPPTSSAGRLFDAVAALAGVRSESTFEAQAAMELEALAGQAGEVEPYRFELSWTPAVPARLVIDPEPCLLAVLADRERGRAPGAMAAAFHAGLARALVEAARQLAQARGLAGVALSGGVFQNRLLLAAVQVPLEAHGLEVATNLLSPANDGGLALGQAWVALHHLARQGESDVSGNTR